MAGIYDVFKKLLPTGRAYKFGRVGEGFIKGTSDEFDRVQKDVDQFLNGIIPDNENFKDGWLERFERFYDIPVNISDSHAIRMARVRDRMTPVDPNLCLLHISALQKEIDDAGWGGILYIHENLSGRLPDDILLPLTPQGQLGDYQLNDEQLYTYYAYIDYPYLFSIYQLGDYQLGDAQLLSNRIFNNKIANSLDRHKDTFANLTPLRHTFYICGPVLGQVVNLPASDEVRLRQLLLSIKPASSVGFLLIKYI